MTPTHSPHQPDILHHYYLKITIYLLDALKLYIHLHIKLLIYKILIELIVIQKIHLLLLSI